MRELTERVKKLRESALDWEETQKEYIGQWMVCALEGLTEAEGLPWMKRKSRMLCGVIERSRPVIHEGELIAGYNYYGSDAGMWTEQSIRKRTGGDRESLEAYLRTGCVDPARIAAALETLDRADTLLPNMTFTSEADGEFARANGEGVIWAYGTPANHTVLGYEKVLRLGFSGIYEEIRRMLDGLDPNDPDYFARKLLLESAGEIARSACALGRRYAGRVEEILSGCADGARRKDLEALIAVLRRVPEHPAETFREAVQALWFAHVLNTWEDGINANSLGRLDQILYPYYRRDIELGRLTDGEAFELICCLWIKLYREYDVQQAALGGVDRLGRDATNELTYLMLDATEALDFVRCLSVRLHAGSPAGLAKRSLEVVAGGRGIPFFFNDDTLIPALVNEGIAIEDARDYAAIGCVEITIPGKANPHAVSNRVNLLKCLELALNGGRSLTTGERIGPATMDPSEMRCIGDVKSAYEKQVEHFTALACLESKRLELEYELSVPMPYKSMLTEGCLESGRDFNAGGAKYDYHESMPMGIPNVADSLAALQKLVFEEKRYALPEVLEILKGDFADESVRREFVNRAPKYGNDDDAADQYAAYAMTHFHSVLKRCRGRRGLGFFMQPFTFLWLVEAGELTAATPDGRRRGENLAYSVSAMQGRDSKGLTALFNSIAKLPARLAAGSISSIVEADPALFEEGRIELLCAMLKTAIEKGVGQVQFNVTDAETLLRAQADPESYRNLSVRVSGFSQRFCLLDRKLQDHIIARTKHKHL